MKPVVAIVGRPNVGKSSLFNRILGRTKALVQDTPGVTRDRNYALAEYEGRSFILVDTGGFEDDDVAEEDRRPMARLIREAAAAALEEADVIVVLLDGKEGPNPVDAELVATVRRSCKPVVHAVNKIDHAKHVDAVYEFYEIGVEQPVAVSAAHNLGVDEVMDEVLALMPVERTGEVVPTPWQDEGRKAKRRRGPRRLSDDMPEEIVTGPGREDRDAGEGGEGDGVGEGEGDGVGEGVGEKDFVLRVAVLGRPNVGKSTLINRLLGYERCIVSDQAGTTRDSIDTYLELDDRRLILIDTAGIRRRARISERVEQMTVRRALRMVEAAHIVWLMLDATEGVTEQDARLGELARERGRGLILVANKWDLARRDRDVVRELKTTVERRMPHLTFAKVVRLSALTGRGVDKLWPALDEVDHAHKTRIETGKLNRWLEAAIAAQSPPLHHHRAIRMYYATQVAIRPPRIVVFSNMPDAIPTNYQRYLVNRLRADFGLVGTPVNLTFRQR